MPIFSLKNFHFDRCIKISCKTIKITIVNLIVSEFTMYQLVIVATIIPFLYIGISDFYEANIVKGVRAQFSAETQSTINFKFLLRPGQCFLGSQNGEKQGGGIWRGGYLKCYPLIEEIQKAIVENKEKATKLREKLRRLLLKKKRVKSLESMWKLKSLKPFEI